MTNYFDQDIFVMLGRFLNFRKASLELRGAESTLAT